MTNKPTAELIAWLDKDLETQKTLLTDFANGDAFEEEINDCALHYQAIKDRLAEQQKVIDGMKAEKENHSALCYAVAVSTLWGLGCQSEAADLAGELSVTLDSVKDVGLSEYDLDNLSELYKAFPWVNQKALQPKAEG